MTAPLSKEQEVPNVGDSTTVVATRAVKRSQGRRLKNRRVILGVTGVVGLIIILEIASRLGFVDPQFLPPFSTVLVTLWGLFGNAGFLSDIWSTLITWFLAIIFSAVVAIPLGILLGLSANTYRAARTVMELVRTLPAVALIPLVIMVIGNGIEMKLVVAVYAAMWPILFNTIYGVRGTDPKAQEMGKSFRLTNIAVIRRIVLPSAAPFIGTGIRVASSIVLIVVITVELLAGGASGLGAFISSMRIQGDRVEDVYAGILVAGLLGLAINMILGALERRFFSWDTTTRGGV